MDEEPSTSGGIKHHIPQDIQDDIDAIASKRPREKANTSDLNDDQKRWLVVGICLHSFISPALRIYVDSILTAFHHELIRYNKIDTQIYSGHLQRDPLTGIFLNYAVVNNNTANYGKNYAKYDYTVKDAVDLSKLFLQTHMAHYKGFDETCDSSALLGLILNIAKFDPVIKSDAENVRTNIRNPWAHCNFSEWDAAKFSDSFQLMKKLVKDLKLSPNEEKLILDEIEKWKINGQRFLSGTTHGLELVNELRQETHVLAEYAALVATKTDDIIMRLTNELKKFKIIFDHTEQLEKDMKNGFSEVDKKLSTQDKCLKKHGTQIEELEEDMNKCAYRDSHNVDIESWTNQDIMFVETPKVKNILQIIESKQSVLIIGEPGIGKSMLLHHIALQNKNEYSIIPCSEIQDIRYHFRKNMKQLFVLDDVFGRLSVSKSDIQYLLKNEESLKLMFEKGKCKIAATCRLDIYNDKRFKASCSLFASVIFNLSEDYSKEDRLTISAKYFKETDIQILKDQNESFTPLMCHLYCKAENFNLTEFLHCPYETYQIEWEKLQSIDPLKYCTLFLFVICNDNTLYGHINVDNNVLTDIFDICRVYRNTSCSKLKEVMDCIIGTYLLKIGETYMVMHDQMFDFMCYYFGNKDIFVRILLRYANIKVINERTQLKSINKQCGKFTIIISEKYEQYYFERIKHDLKHGHMTQCFCNAQMKHDNYRAIFLKILRSIDNKYTTDHHIIKENIITACFKGYFDVVKYFISKKVYLDTGYKNATPLTAACRGGNPKIVRLLVDKGVDVNRLNGIGETPLIAACKSGIEKIVHILVQKGVDVNKGNNRGDTPLTAACRNGNDKIVQLLIDRGCDINRVKWFEEPPLIAACKGANEKIIQLLIENGSDVNQVDCQQRTPLAVACEEGNERIVEFLIDNGSDINQLSEMRLTPLTVACSGDNEHLVQLIIDKGCEVNNVGRTPLRAASDTGNLKIIQILIDSGSVVDLDGNGSRTHLSSACFFGQKKLVQFLIEKGCDVNKISPMGETPLVSACLGGYKEIVQLLINNGCSVNQVADRGYAPLEAACIGRNEQLTQLIIDSGSEINMINQVDCIGNTPLTHACFWGSYTMVKYLIEKGSDINQVDGNGETPLTVAGREEGNGKIVQLLIEKGGDVNYFDGKGATPLTAAGTMGNDKTVKILIDKGANVNQINGKGETPLTAAGRTGKWKVVKMLINKGGDISQIDGKGETPLTAACRTDNWSIVQILIDKGSDVNQVDGKGETPLTAARRKGNEHITQLIIDKGGDVNEVDVNQLIPRRKLCVMVMSLLFCVCYPTTSLYYLLVILIIYSFFRQAV